MAVFSIGLTMCMHIRLKTFGSVVTVCTFTGC